MPGVCTSFVMFAVMSISTGDPNPSASTIDCRSPGCTVYNQLSPWQTTEGEKLTYEIKSSSYSLDRDDAMVSSVDYHAPSASSLPPASSFIGETQDKTLSSMFLALENHPGIVADENKNVILVSDIYKGRRTLVYKLAPGGIFQGIRQESLPTESQISPHQYKHWDSNDDFSINTKLRDSQYVGTHPVHFSGRNKQNPFKGKTKKPARSPHIRWNVHYVQPPPSISSMENPYLPTKMKKREKPKLLRVLNVNNPVFPHPPPGSNLFMYPIAKAMQVARTKARGARISFLLLHYLGFMPFIPGFPRHKDPKEVMTGIMHTMGKGK
ncbi:hypothetical protein SK128_004235, partial [Halocaridina rubra]